MVITKKNRFKREKNIGNFFVTSSFQTNDQSELSKVLAHDAKLVLSFISEPKRSIKIIGHFTCTTAYVIYCITCTYCSKLYIGETGRRLGDRFREHLRDLERNDKDASQQVAEHFNVPNHSKQHMAVCGLFLHLGNSESCKTLEQKFIFQIGTLNLMVSTSAFHSTNSFFFSRQRILTNSVALFSAYKPTHNS